MLQRSASAIAITACLMFAAQAHAADAPATNAADAATATADELDGVVVVGSGQTRSVSTLTPASLEVLPPGTSVQKALNFLPGVMAQSIDALGVNEQSLSLQVRGFNTTHLGYTLDGMPLGDGAYNNYNGLTISRALISENLGRADLATGIAGLSIPSTSNLGGALIYVSSDPKKDMGLSISQSFGSEDTLRTFARFDTGEYNGWSAYLSGQYSEQDLFVNQPAYNKSTGKQFNGKLTYKGERGQVTAFADISRTNQADDAYLSKDMRTRLGWDWGGYAPNWDAYVARAACSVPSLASKCVTSTAPEKLSDVTFTNGQILRNDDLFYVAADFDVTDTLKAHGQVYKHENKGAGNNFITGLSTQGTTSTADDLPVQIRDTRYTIDRDGVVASLAWTVGFNHLQAGLWLEQNTSSAARYIWTNVTGPFSLAQYLKGRPDTAQWVQKTDWTTQQFYVQDTITLLDDALSIDFGFKSTNAKSTATALPGIAKAPAAASTQFASGSLKASDSFLPEAGARWRIAPGHEVFASYAENMAMFQGGFKLGPQSVSQAVWDAQGKYLEPETSKSFDAGYRYVGETLQISVSAYEVDFDNRLLQYNPCPTNQQQNPGCGNSFHNAGSVTSKGAEIGVLWKPLSWLNWYNSASYNESTYDEDLNWCSGATCVVKKTAGKQQVDTPKEMFASVVSLKRGPFSASLQGKYTGRRYYTYTNDQSFGGYTTFDLGLGYRFGQAGFMKGAKASLNITNLTDKRYASNFDSSVFAPDDATGSILVFHSSAPRQFFATIGFDF
ncbi:TonB-dependent receptor [Caulobacter flavus]|uniref:TonB-dependent receptor n=1 Tax=Caulobacter flavus TaxID=1679497 RepID=A0A2N5D214_9CAUL|nr:TonB-dependent receptor [Caulobacter flavus]AYV46787.1 TonB-dependent receptor [Caulobacter flavus]PLR20071.1 TonB-dependent receptor [Caulobacter flavus]